MGTCDYCGEWCAQLGVSPVEWFEFNDWIPPSAIDRHTSLVARRLACSTREGWGYTTTHVGPPEHDSNGDPIDECTNCSSSTAMDTGDWDTSMDHSQCPTCWSEIAGGHVVYRWRAAARKRRGKRGLAEQPATQGVVPVSPDRRRAEAALRAYAGVELPTVHWAPSPLDVVRVLGEAIDAQGDELFTGEPERALPPWSIRAPDADDLGVPDRHDVVVQCLAAAIVEQHPEAAGTHAALVPWLLSDAGEFSAPIGAGRLRPLIEELRVTTGAAVILPGSIVVSERALRCSLDDRGRPHATDGPAIAYRDGFEVYAWHGVAVPEWLVRHPERLDVETIDAEENIEVRRVMIECFGAERLVREGGAELVHEDETGRLWRRRLPTIRRPLPGWGQAMAADQPVTYVEVENSTPEPDGSRRTYFLRVPPEMLVAREAVAWTFGLGGGEYHPAAES